MKYCRFITRNFTKFVKSGRESFQKSSRLLLIDDLHATMPPIIGERDIFSESFPIFFSSRNRCLPKQFSVQQCKSYLHWEFSEILLSLVIDALDKAILALLEEVRYSECFPKSFCLCFKRGDRGNLGRGFSNILFREQCFTRN